MVEIPSLFIYIQNSTDINDYLKENIKNVLNSFITLMKDIVFTIMLKFYLHLQEL